MGRSSYTKIKWNDWSGGMDLYTPADALLELYPKRFRDCENFRCADGDLTLRPGSSKWNSTVLSAGACKGLFRYYYAGNKRFLYAAGTDVYVGTPGSTNSFGAGAGYTLTGMTQATFAQFRDIAYMAHDSTAKGILRYTGSAWSVLEDLVITAPGTAPTITPQSTTIDTLDSTTNWTSNDNTNFTLAAESSLQKEGTGCFKITCDQSGALNDYIIRDLGSGNEQDWSGINQVTYYIMATNLSGQPFPYGRVSLGISEDNSAWNECYDYTASNDGQWTQITWDLSSIAAESRDAIRYIRFKNGSKSSTDHILYLDIIDAGGVVGMGDDRQYAYSYYNSTDRNYSLLSPESLIVQNLDEYMENLVTGARSSFTGVDKVRIYRTKAGEDLSSDNPAFYLVDEISNPDSGAWTYTDRKRDTQLGAVFNEYAASGVQAPDATNKYIVLHEDRMYYAGSTTNPSRVQISNWQDPITCPTITFPTNADAFDDTVGGYLDIARQDGQSITCLIPYPAGVLALKEHSAYDVTGTTFNPFGSQPFRYDLISGAGGGVGPWAGCFCENEVAWVSRDTVWAWRPGELMDIGRPISSIIKAIPAAYRKYTSCVYHERKLHIFYTVSGGTYNTRKLVYDFDRGAWTRESGQNGICGVVAKNPGDSGELYFGDSNAGYIWQGETGTTDGGTAITGKWLSGILQDEGNTVRLRYFDIIADGTTAAVTATLSIYRSKSASLGDTADTTITYDLQGSDIQDIEGSVSDANTSTQFQFALQLTASEAVRIRQMLPYFGKVRG